MGGRDERLETASVPRRGPTLPIPGHPRFFPRHDLFYAFLDAPAATSWGQLALSAATGLGSVGPLRGTEAVSNLSSRPFAGMLRKRLRCFFRAIKCAAETTWHI